MPPAAGPVLNSPSPLDPARPSSRLQATHKGLTQAEADKRLAEYGPNMLPESTRNAFLVYLGVSVH